MVQAEVADRLAADPGQPGLRRPVGEGPLVRRRPPGRLRRPHRVLAGTQRRLRPRRRRPPTAAVLGGRTRRGLRHRRRRLRAATQDAAGRARRLGRVAGGRRDGAARGRHRPRRARRAARRRGVRGARRAATAPRVRCRDLCRHDVGLGDRPRPGQGQPPAVGGCPAPGRLPRPRQRLPRRRALRRRHRHRRTAAASRSPSPASPPPRSPPTSRTSRCAQPLALAEATGVDADVRPARRQGHPGRRRHGRRLRRRSRRAARLRPACGAPASSGSPCRSWPRASAPTYRSLCSAVRRVGVGTGTHLTPALARGKFPWVFAVADGGTVDARGLRRVRPDGRRATCRRSRGCPTPSWRRCGPATRRRSASALSNDLQKPALALRPQAAVHPRRRASSTAPSARRLGLRTDLRLPGPRRVPRPRPRRRAVGCRRVPHGEARRRSGARRARRRRRGLADLWLRSTSSTSRRSARRSAPARCSTG